jgi:hypothetical protein
MAHLASLTYVPSVLLVLPHYESASEQTITAQATRSNAMMAVPPTNATTGDDNDAAITLATATAQRRINALLGDHVSAPADVSTAQAHGVLTREARMATLLEQADERARNLAARHARAQRRQPALDRLPRAADAIRAMFKAQVRDACAAIW